MELFVLSFALAVGWSWKAARDIGLDAAERFWVFWTALALQVSVLAWSLSLFRWLTPWAWGIWQIGLVLAWWAFQGLRRGYRTGRPVPLLEPATPRHRLTFRGDLGTRALWIVLAAVVALSAWERWRTPLYGRDERQCHASRVLYWIQHQTILPYETHNIRQNVFPFGSELFFLWPVLLTRDEAIGRLVFWVAYPALLYGAYLLLGELGTSRPVATLGALVLGMTPIVRTHAITLKPNLWQALFVLGTAFWCLRIVKNRGERAPRPLWGGALCSILSIHTHYASLPILFIVAILVFFMYSGSDRLPSLKAWLGGIALGLVLSGIWVPWGYSLIRYGHILGPPAFRKVHSSDLSIRQVYTHTVRFVFQMLEWPSVPDERLRLILEHLGRRLSDRLGASKPLPMETDQGWPGIYRFSVPPAARSYSLGGLVWLIGIGIGSVHLIREIARSYPRIDLSPLSVLTLLDVPLTMANVWFVRWMAQSGIPERLLIAPYALGIIMTTWWLSIWSAGRRLRLGLLIWGILWMGLASIDQQIRHLQALPRYPLPRAELDEPFAEVMELLPTGARILLIAHQDARDYPLFAPRSHYANRVVSWGRFPWDPDRMQSLIRQHRITHVLIQDEEQVSFHWDPPIATRPMVEWLAHQPDVRDIPLLTPRMRLFGILSNLQKLGPGIRGTGCRSAFGSGWYDLERSGSDWWRWTDGRGQIQVITAADMQVTLQGELFAIQTPNAVRIVINGRPAATVQVSWQGFGAFPPVHVPLQTGRNTLELVSQWPPVRVPPDPRPLAVAVKNLRIRPMPDTECRLIGIER